MVQFRALESGCLGSGPGNAVCRLCNLANCPSFIFLFYKMDLMIALPRLLGALKGNAHQALRINIQCVLAIRVPPLCSFAMAQPRLTSPVSQPSRSAVRPPVYDAGGHGEGPQCFLPIPLSSCQLSFHELTSNNSMTGHFIPRSTHQHTPANTWDGSSGALFVEFSIIEQKSANFYAKDLRINILGFSGYSVSVAATHICPVARKWPYAVQK